MSEVQSIFSEFGYTLDNTQRDRFEAYIEVLMDWNRRVNLTGAKKRNEILRRHFVDSLLLADRMDLSNKRALDVGSGAGFPGVPLKILYPSMDLTIVDATLKRVRFLEELSKRLSLPFEAIHGRVEHLQKTETFDIVTARAVARLDVLVELCLPFAKVDGFFVPYKGERFRSELKTAESAIKHLGGVFDGHYAKNLDGGESVVLFIKKVASTPAGYPRRYKDIKRKPL